MTILMLLSARFHQGQETRWVRKHKASDLSVSGRCCVMGGSNPARGLGEQACFPAHANPSSLGG